MAHICKTDLEKYLDNLYWVDGTMKDLYDRIHSAMLAEEDTLGEEFQILVDLDSVFWKHAEMFIKDDFD